MTYTTNKLPHIQRRRALLGAAAAGLCAAWPGASFGQSRWPAKPVTLIVPFPAGGGTDAFARPMSAQFAKLTGTQLVIDNHGGAISCRRWYRCLCQTFVCCFFKANRQATHH